MDHSSTRPLLQDTEVEDNDIQDEDDFPTTSINSAVQDLKLKIPRDSYNLWFLTFYLLGVVTLLPWNFFITAHDYWMYKFRDINSTQISLKKSDLQAEFTSYLSLAATGPSVFFLILNSLLSHRISLNLRMIGSFALIILMFVTTTIFVEINTDPWQNIFFFLTLSIVVCVNVGGAILNAGIWAIVSKFGSRYITAMVSGQALAGVFAALASIGTLAIGASSTRCALFYFLVANVTLAISFITYISLTRSVFFKYHMLIKSPANTLQYDPAELDNPEVLPVVHVSLVSILKKIWHHGFALFYCYTVSLAVYPAVTVLVMSSSEIKDKWTDVYFVPVISFLLFSTFDYIGRILAGIFVWPKNSPWTVVVFSLLRTVFIPLVLLCNAHPRRYLPVVFPQDYAYIIISVLFGTTNGYLTNITTILVPIIVAAEEQEISSSIMAAFLGVGCAAGSFLSIIMVKIL